MGGDHLWDAIGAIGEIIGASAVVFTLFYLAIQVRQNTRQEQLDSFQTAKLTFLGTLDDATTTAVDAEIFRKGLNHFDDLIPSEQGVFHSRMHSLLHGFHGVWQMYKAGTLPEYELVAMRTIYVEFLICPGGRKWWEAFKHIPPPHLVEYLDDEIEKAAGRLTPASEAYPWLRADDVQANDG
jgi:hypothetical protein